MKKIAFLTSSIISLLTPVTAFAQSPAIKVSAPPGRGFPSITNFITNFLFLAFGIALLVVLVMLIQGAFEWITSGGDKEAVAKARNRIINALIGLAVLAVAFALTRVAGQFLGFNITDIAVPSPLQTVPAGEL
ncbi:hypothetical protein HYW41_00715 [Candidatus Daviesbacteria bacterium]|nr:hypothetical protein [Candidatus Daviesbacteria bacterium]